MNLYVERTQIQNFCMKIAIYLFLKEYRKYNIIDANDYVSDNVFIAESEGTKVIVSLFSNSRSTISKFKKKYNVDMVHIYRMNDGKKHKNTESLSNFFFTDSFTKVLLDANENDYMTYIFKDKNDKLINILFSEFLDFNYSEEQTFYKYKGRKGVRVQEMIDGEITYSNPNTFNDPFDCDFVAKSFLTTLAINLKDQFRVLCLSPKYDDILMWGYYGNSHDGVCVGHTLDDILSSTMKVYNGLIIYGNIRYSNKRPNYICKMPAIIGKVQYFAILSQLTKCCFTKYREWQHEKEFRIVTFIGYFDDSIEYSINENGNKNYDYVPVKGNTNSIYLGCNNNSSISTTSGVTPYKLHMHNKKYKLI